MRRSLLAGLCTCCTARLRQALACSACSAALLQPPSVLPAAPALSPCSWLPCLCALRAGALRQRVARAGAGAAAAAPDRQCAVRWRPLLPPDHRHRAGQHSQHAAVQPVPGRRGDAGAGPAASGTGRDCTCRGGSASGRGSRAGGAAAGGSGCCRADWWPGCWARLPSSPASTSSRSRASGSSGACRQCSHQQSRGADSASGAGRGRRHAVHRSARHQPPAAGGGRRCCCKWRCYCCCAVHACAAARLCAGCHARRAFSRLSRACSRQLVSAGLPLRFCGQGQPAVSREGGQSVRRKGGQPVPVN